MQIISEKVYTPPSINGTVAAVRATATASAGVPVPSVGTVQFDGVAAYQQNTWAALDPIGVHNHVTTPTGNTSYANGVGWDNYVAGTGIPPWTTAGKTWSLSRVFDATKNRKVARFEVRPGDTALNAPAERSQVAYVSQTNAPTGSTFWYKWTIKFDSTFHGDRGGEVGWALFGDPHSETSAGNMPIGFGASYQVPNNLCILFAQYDPVTDVKQWGNASQDIWRTPINVGTWHNLKFQICWHPTNGFIRLWYNDVPQTMFWQASSTFGAGSGTTFPGTTTRAGQNQNWWQDVIYRGGGSYYSSNGWVDIVYMGGLVMATSEAALGAGY